MSNTTINDNVKDLLGNALAYSRNTRQCETLEDLDFLYSGIARVIGDHESGRGFLQFLGDNDSSNTIARATYFDNLHSTRRRDMTSECETHLRRDLAARMKEREIDHLRKFTELEGFDILAYDGHFHKHACHAERDSKGRTRPVGGIYAMDMRTGLIQRVVTTDFDTNKTNELKAFRETFSTKDPKGRKRKTIAVVDKAYFDGNYWELCSKMKKSGMYFISLLKDGLIIEKEESLAVDEGHAYNCGIVSDIKVTLKTGGPFRKIVYIDPETETERVFLTSVFNVPPGLIAHLYLWRWKIEKVFNTFKSKLKETKAWANGKIAVDTQASLTAMTYNILLAAQEITLGDEGVEEEKLQKKWKESIERRREKAKKLGRFLNPLVEIPHKLRQLSSQFIRCFRTNFENDASWAHCLPKFRQAMAGYL